jgi:iron complex transport system substrate-binding protein
MRAFACALAISLASAAPAEAAPKRAASLKLCTDEILLMLAEPEQIASVTFLAHQPLETTLWQTARHYPKNDGSLLSVSQLRPDVIFDMGGGGRDVERIAHRLRIPVVMLLYPQSLADMKGMIRTVASALGRQAAGARLVDRIEWLERTAPPAPKDTIWLGGGGRSVAAHGLAADWMRLAGLRQRPLRGDRVSLEHLLAAPPAILLRSDYRRGQYSGEQRWLAHPLARGTKRSRTLAADGRRWTCMGPTMIGEIERLRREVGR